MAQVKDFYVTATKYANLLIHNRLVLDVKDHEFGTNTANEEFKGVIDRVFDDQPRGKEFDDLMKGVLEVLQIEQAKGEFKMLKGDELLIAFNDFAIKEMKEAQPWLIEL